MKRLFLSSEFSVSGDNLRDLVELENFDSIAYIGNAADLDKDRSWTQMNRSKLEDLGFAIIDIDLRQIQGDALKERLIGVDAIYVEGGNTFYLLELCNKSGFSGLIKDLVSENNKLYIGTSAGSIIAGPNIESTKFIDDPARAGDLENFTGFGLVNFVIVPHIGNDDFFKETEEGYKNLFRNLENYQHPHVSIRDEQAVWVQGDKLSIV